MLALCFQHLQRLTGCWATEAATHRSKATQLLQLEMENGESRDWFHILESILLMFTLDVSSVDDMLCTILMD